MRLIRLIVRLAPSVGVSASDGLIFHFSYLAILALCFALFFQWRPTKQTDHGGWYRARVRILVRSSVESGVSCDYVLCFVMCLSIVARWVRCPGPRISHDFGGPVGTLCASFHCCPFRGILLTGYCIFLHLLYCRSDWCTIESDPGVFVSFMLSGTSPATSFIFLPDMSCCSCSIITVIMEDLLYPYTFDRCAIFCCRVASIFSSHHHVHLLLHLSTTGQ